MPPKGSKAGASPRRKASHSIKGSTTQLTPPPEPTEEKKDASATPVRGASLTHSAATPSPSNHAAQKEAVVTLATPRRIGVYVAALLLVVSLLLAAAFWPAGGGTDGRHPCACVAASAATADRLAKAVLSRRVGVSGLHWQHSGDLAKALHCGDMVIVPLAEAFRSAAQLYAALQPPFAKHHTRCVVWVTTPEAIEKTANALKELMENNALGGRTVVPAGSRGVLVVQSTESREQLKTRLPHRVVHMLTTVS